MAEVHVIGQILGGSGFQGHSVFCKWGLHAGRSWELIEGLDEGQTHVDWPRGGDMAVWSHPLDFHYVCRSISGWPRLFLQVWSQDIHGRNELCGYGFCHVPTSPGMNDLECPTWLPEGSQLEQLNSFFVGGTPRLCMEEVAYTPGDRFRLQTAASGVVHVQLGVLMKDMDKFNISTG